MRWLLIGLTAAVAIWPIDVVRGQEQSPEISAAEQAAAQLESIAELLSDGPWQDSDAWTMELQGVERIFIDYKGASYLAISLADLNTPQFVRNKDIIITAKFASLTGSTPVFYHFDDITVTNSGDTWASTVDGDNVHLLGTLTGDTNNWALAIDHIAKAPSDAERIGNRLATLTADDWAGRLQVAQWARQQAEHAGNNTYWLSAADDIVRQAVRNRAVQASRNQDISALLEAIDWSLNLANDPSLAAELASSKWVIEHDSEGARSLGPRLQELGFGLFQHGDDSQWLPNSQVIQKEFTVRYDQLHWRDAEGYFQLGRWADARADVLPAAKQLAHEAYQAGFRADETHSGIRHELGLPPVTSSTKSPRGPQDFSTDAGVIIRAPRGWDRTPSPLVGTADATWVDPRSDSAWLSARAIDNERSPSFDSQWREAVQLASLHAGFAAGPITTVVHAQGQARRMRYQIQAGEAVRPAELIVVYQNKDGFGIALTASFEANEADSVRTALNQALESLVLPQRSKPEPAVLVNEDGGVVALEANEDEPTDQAPAVSDPDSAADED